MEKVHRYSVDESVSYVEEFKFMRAVLKLFKAVPVISASVKQLPEFIDNDATILSGYLLTPELEQASPLTLTVQGLSILDEVLGHDIVKLNKSFYNSMNSVSSKPVEELLVNQILHYFTTYGREFFGNFDRSVVYIPNDNLNLPKEVPPVKINIVRFITIDEITERISRLINTSVALKDETLYNICSILSYLSVNEDVHFDIDTVKNKELRIRMYDVLGKVPAKAEEFLRLLIFKATGKSLLIKDKETLDTLKISLIGAPEVFYNLFSSYLKLYGFIPLAEVFLRFKPIFLAFKKVKSLKSSINKLRKLAVKYHKPKGVPVLDQITSSPTVIQAAGMSSVIEELKNVSVFKKISILNAMLYRNANPTSFSYVIRNGKVFSEYVEKSFNFNFDMAYLLIDEIVNTLRKNVKDKTVYLPDNFEYACPTSEKKFVDNIPFGSSYTFQNNSFIIGIHWLNLKNKASQELRIDLDFHAVSNKRAVGWNTYMNTENYKNCQKHFMVFSGDMTDAPTSSGGATEAFYIGADMSDEIVRFAVNNFTYSSGTKENVPFNLILSDEPEDFVFSREYLIDNSSLMFHIPMIIPQREMTTGVLIADETGTKKFYFFSGQLSNSRISGRTKSSEVFLSSMKTSFETQLKLRPLLERAGAVINSKPDDVDYDFNLDTSVVAKDTILSMFS